MIALQHFLPGALAAVLREAPLNDDKITFAWRAVVGPGLARSTHVKLVGDVLQVRASGPSWQREITRSEALIRSRIEVLLGRGIVRQIEVTAGTLGTRPAQGRT